MKISKKIKEDGKVTLDAPKVKSRKRFAPVTKVEPPKKGRGSKKPKKETFDEDEEILAESTVVADFIEAVMEKRYADAYRFMEDVVELKIRARMSKELDTPLF